MGLIWYICTHGFNMVLWWMQSTLLPSGNPHQTQQERCMCAGAAANKSSKRYDTVTVKLAALVGDSKHTQRGQHDTAFLTA